MTDGIPQDQLQHGAFGAEGPPRLDYGSYLQVGHLVGLQKPLSEPAQHDEILFIVIHQVYELWFKQLLHEIDEIIERLRHDEALGAQRLLRRCIEIERILLAQLTVLETMTPTDFLTFRDRLMPASGFQSMQFRALEFVSGLKDPRHLGMFDPDSPERRALERRLEEPTLGESLYALLRQRGFHLPEDPGGEGEGNSEAREARVRELLRIYQQPDDHYDIYLLLEALIEYDETFTLWRLRHVTMVERMIGAKPGTGGSEGVSYLKTTLERKFFPELWEVRSLLGSSDG